MQKNIVYRKMDSEPVLEQFANKHLEKIEKLLHNERSPVVIDLVLEPSTVHAHHRVTLIVRTPDYDLVANHEGPEMYQEIDLVTDKMVQEIRRAKDRLVTERQANGSLKGREEVEEESDEDSEEEEE